jgi:hypothetical protein
MGMIKDGSVKLGKTPCECNCSTPAANDQGGHVCCKRHSTPAGEKRASAASSLKAAAETDLINEHLK